MAFRLFKNRPPKEVPDAPQETEKDKALNDWIDDMVSDAETDRADWDVMAEDAISYTYGNQLKNLTVKDGWETVQCDFIRPALDQQVALVQQQETTIYTQPREESDVPGSAIAQGLFRWYYDVGLKVPDLRGACVIDGWNSGNWVLMPRWEPRPDGGWDEDKRDWDGRIEVTLVPREFFGVDPEAEKVGHGEFVLLNRRVYVEWAKHRWPEYKDAIARGAKAQLESREMTADGPKPTGWKPFYIGQDESDVNTGEVSKNKPKSYGRLARLLGGQRLPLESMQSSENEALETVELLEIWFRDREMKHVSEEKQYPYEQLVEEGSIRRDEATGFDYLVDQESGEEVLLSEENWPTYTDEYDRPVYPYGRHILRIGKEVLNKDEDEQVWPYKKGWPFIVGKFNELPHTWRGQTGVEGVKTVQDWYNIAFAHLLNFLKNFADPRIMVEHGALHGVTTAEQLKEKLKSVAGAVMEFAPNRLRNGYKVESPPQMTMDIVTILRLLEDLMRNVMGVHEIAQGKQGGSGMTATEALRLETNSRLRTSLLSKELNRTTGPELMEWVWELIKAHMAPGDVVRIIGEEGGEATVAMLEGDFDAKFDLDIQVGTTLPFDKQRKKDEALQLTQVFGPAYYERLLDAFEVSNPEQVLSGNRISSLIEQAGEIDPTVMEEVLAAIEQLVAEYSQQEAEGGETGGAEAAVGMSGEGRIGPPPVLAQESVSE